ncbi:MAG: DUF2007 domain-containing protein [Limnochordia bacterium]|jgi:hypothetical protein|nr:DUF2007 domain-containing protein [Bacillota bacterium]HOB09362.1 DUF2007 domain-containing protein [Limnochordia bacterium]NLH31392.1 DUF2007 domain-containing protein [Bacillota bacterium]HPT93357.1 DUF2007 domain-containing protein [Limnochordia bacterium]HPZ30458.1 DUF2007 domain-containing protein [Limnochordia bacterium]
MWTVVYIAPNHAIAGMLKELLNNEGFVVMLRPVGPPHLGASGSVEILVPDSEAEEALEIITAAIGNSTD